jgi:5-methylcytosine-specific restriction endonuclease McrA
VCRRAYVPVVPTERVCANPTCGKVFFGRGAQRFHDHTCATQDWRRRYRKTEKGREERRRYKLKDARLRAAAKRHGEEFTLLEIAQRDGWRCHICRGKTKRVPGSAQEPRGAVLDHLIPIAHGGEHTHANIAVAHWLCNSRRGDRGTVQLRLS